MITTQKEYSTYDTPTLAATLAMLGVPYLRTTTFAMPVSMEPPSFIAALAQHEEPRVREALIPLFLRHPTYSQYVPELAAIEPEPLHLRHLYTAAVYLQRLWRGTLGIYLGDFAILPDYFGQQEFALPHPDEHFGELGLRLLAELFRQKTGYNWLSTYNSAMSLFLTQLRLERYR